MILKSGVTFSKGANIGSGCLVTKSIPDYAIAAGNQAKVIKYSDQEIFDELYENIKNYLVVDWSPYVGNELITKISNDNINIADYKIMTPNSINSAPVRCNTSNKLNIIGAMK